MASNRVPSDEPAAVRGGDAERVHDLWLRLLLSPVLGVVIPNMTGLIDHSRHGSAGLAGSYLYFSLIAFVIWEGNRRIYFRVPHREDWLEHPWRRIARLIGVIVLYTVPVAAVLMWTWRLVSGDPGAGPHAIPMAVLAAVTGVVVITHAYETVFLLHDWESDRLRRARTEQARLEAELAALGRQVDPHFLFNHLNALACLIESRSPAAISFLTALADTYRYVLDARDRRLVPLEDELGALARHETLARLEKGSVALRVDVDAALAQGLALPPACLAELFQNAIKHNVADEASPLRITVRIEGSELVCANDLRARSPAAVSMGVGLANLSRRFLLATGREATWMCTETEFVVRLPLVPISSATQVGERPPAPGERPNG